MRSAKFLGPVSLGLSVVGMVVTEALIHTGVLAHPWWRVLAMGFEAGTIGGMADWFAVSALFRRVPIPLLVRHSDIIVKNRARIVESLKDFVQNRLLTPTAIREKLAGVSFSSLGLRYLDHADHRQQLHRTVRSLIGTFVTDLERDDLAAFVQRVAKERLLAIEVAMPLGTWMHQAMEQGDHHGLWNGIIGECSAFVTSPPFKQRLVTIIKTAAAKERGEGRIKKWFLSTAEATGGFDYESWANQLSEALSEWLEKVQADPQHDFRQQADGYLRGYASAMAAGRPDVVASVETFKQGVLQNADLEPLIRTAISEVKVVIERGLADDQSSLSQAIAAMVDGFIEKLRTDPTVQAYIDHHMRDAMSKLVDTNHALIGDMVGNSLSPQKISDRALVAQIEDRIGSDLQYIRLNGAIVGGVVGALIMAAKLTFLGN